jgi:hypothetical protein
MKTIDMVPSVPDPVIQEIRRHKGAIAEAFGFDVVALGRSLQERQARDPRFAISQGVDGQPTTRSETK